MSSFIMEAASDTVSSKIFYEYFILKDFLFYEFGLKQIKGEFNKIRLCMYMEPNGDIKSW